MRGYDTEERYPAEEEEDGYDDYYDEDDGHGHEDEGEGEEYEEEEDPQPTKEEMEYLELRQRLKEQIRKKNKKANSSAHNNTNDRKRKLPYDNYGSFFGPSKPVISQRVIQESKSLLETQHLTPKVSNSHHPSKKSNGSSTAGSKPEVHNKKAKIVNEVRTKVQKLKDTRDYSFLLSDDAQTPAPAKVVAPQRPATVPSSEARHAQVPLKSKQGLTSSSRPVNGSHGERKLAPTNGHVHSKAGSNRLPSASRPNLAPVDSRKLHSSGNGTGPGRPLGPKGGVPSKTPTSMEKKAPAPIGRSSVPSMQKPLSSKLQPPSRTQPPSRSQPTSTLHPSSRSQPPPRSQPPSRSQPLSKSQPSVSRQHMEQRRELQGSTKAKLLPKQPAELSRPEQIHKPQRPNSSHPTSHDNRPKKKPRRHSDDEDDDDGQAAISMIRKMFGYNPNKFSGRDDDDSDMEANFDDIMREEKRSAKIAREEDEEQLRLIEAEERAERLAKLKKLKKR